MGMRSQYQFYTVRNCLFEPALFDSIDNVSTCIRQIESAYRWGQPAIISSHRVNYMSRIDQNNREKHIELLDDLFNRNIKSLARRSIYIFGSACKSL